MSPARRRVAALLISASCPVAAAPSPRVSTRSIPVLPGPRTGPAAPIVPLAPLAPAAPLAPRAAAAAPAAEAPALPALEAADAALARAPQAPQASAALGAAFDASAPKAGAVSAEPAAPGLPGRLDPGVVPVRYELAIRVDPAKGVYTGRLKLRVRALGPRPRLTLNALGLKVTRAVVAGRAAPAAADEGAETVTLEAPLPAGESEVELEYSGALNRMMRGFFEARGRHEGKEESYAFTHLEPTHARRLLPCFDEPAFKAPFQLEITAPAALTALSNMPETGRAEEGGWRTTRFDQTPVMSSYLLAVAVGRLAPVPGKAAGTRLAAWTAPGDVRQAGFALETAREALRRLNAYFALPYMLPKLDLVSVPDFAAGAMENWGAVFFRDAALLIDPELSSPRARRRVAETVTHEVVHQWFGNLVTMRWWNDLWLNEAFATWLAFKVVDRWQPKWRMWLEFEKDRRVALGLDALRQTRAVSAQATTPAEIQALFDPLTYEKGGAILRMLESFLGEAAFRRGLRAYIRRHQYGSAAAGDLWRELEASSGQPVARIAADWLEQPGYPLVSLERTRGRVLRLSQRRFTADGKPAPGRWAVPLVIRYRLEGERRARTHAVLLTEPSQTVTLPGKGRLLWAWPNAEERGFFRSELSPELLKGALRARAELSEVERAALLQHAWALARAGRAPVARALEVASALRDDRSVLVLEDLASFLKWASDQLVSDKDRPVFTELAAGILAPHAERLGWEARRGDAEGVRLARAAVLAAHAELIDGAGARARLKGYLADPASVDPLLAPIVLEASARAGDARLFDELLARMRGAATPEQRDMLLKALGSFREPALLRRALELALADEVRAQDAWKPFVWAFSDPRAQDAAWAFARENWKALLDKLGPRGAGRIIAAAADLRDADAVESFFSAPENRVALAAKPLAQAVETIRLGAALRRREAGGRWLRG